MKIVCVNPTYDRPLTRPDALLERYETLVEWANAVKSAGADVSVVQRFGSDAELTRDGVHYRFVFDPCLKDGSIIDKASRINKAVHDAAPDVVHVNGLQFGRQAARLKRSLEIPVLIQDHKNRVPQRGIARWGFGPALQMLDAISFVSREQAKPWLDAGLLQPNQTVVELMEGSSKFVLKNQWAAREATQLAGDPLCLWVGRLDANKDPLTILQGFAKAIPSLPNPRLAMVYGLDTLLPEVKRWLAQNPAVASRVSLLGRLPRAQLENIYNSADIFLLGSLLEGSGYAVLEALSCGVMPIVTSIPPFRVLTQEGKIGALWSVGDAKSLAQAFIRGYAAFHPGMREEIRAFFDAHFQWNVIGREALDVYRRLNDPKQIVDAGV